MLEDALGVGKAQIASLPFEKTTALHDMFLSHAVVSLVMVVFEEGNICTHQ